jgi:hypothetical protein
MMENKSMVVRKPRAAPVAAMVYWKNLRPKKVTSAPNKRRRVPRM